MSILFLSSAVFLFLPSYFVDVVAQERALSVKERRFGHASAFPALLAAQVADLTAFAIPATVWLLCIYFIVPFLYDTEWGPPAVAVYYGTLIMTAEMGMALLIVSISSFSLFHHPSNPVPSPPLFPFSLSSTTLSNQFWPSLAS